MPPAKKSGVPTTRQIEQALATLKALGAKVDLPSTTELTAKEKASRAKLGFSSAKTKPQAEATTELVVTLKVAHSVSGVIYGPGVVRFSQDQAGLANSLLYQDKLTVAEGLDSAANRPFRSFLITRGRGADPFAKHTKVEVGSLDTMYSHPATEVGIHDIAGYNPSFNTENRDF